MLSYPAKGPPAVNWANWNAMVDRVGALPAIPGDYNFKQDANYIIWTDGVDYYANDPYHTVFGGPGDIVVDGADAAAVINAAINVLDNDYAGKISFLGSNFPLSTSLIVEKNRLTLAGAGYATVLEAQGDFPVLDINPSGALGTELEQMTVKDMTIKGNANTNVNGHGIQGTWINRCLFRDLFITKCRHALHFKRIWNSTLENVMCYGTDGNKNHVGVYTEELAAYENNFIANRLDVTGTVSHGFQLRSQKGTFLVNSGCGDCGGHGIFVEYVVGKIEPAFLHFVNVASDTITGDAFHFEHVEHLMLTQPWAGSVTGGVDSNGIYLEACFQPAITSPTIRNIGGHGIYINTGAGPFSAGRGNITGGSIIDWDNENSGTKSAIMLNEVGGVTIANISLLANTTYDKLIYGTSTEDILLNGCYFYSEDSTDISVEDLIWANCVWASLRMEVSGTATILNGQDHVTFAHGLVGEPTEVSLGAKHAEVADAVWSSAAGALTITASGAVTADRTISYFAKYQP